MPLFVDVRGATVAYEFVDVTFSAIGPYGRRNQTCRISLDATDAALFALLRKRCEEAERKQLASAPPTMGPIG